MSHEKNKQTNKQTKNRQTNKQTNKQQTNKQKKKTKQNKTNTWHKKKLRDILLTLTYVE